MEVKLYLSQSIRRPKFCFSPWQLLVTGLGMVLIAKPGCAILCSKCNSSAGDESCIFAPPPPVNCSTCIQFPTLGSQHQIMTDLHSGKRLPSNNLDGSPTPTHSSYGTPLPRSTRRLLGPQPSCYPIGTQDNCITYRVYDLNNSLLSVNRGCSPLPRQADECYMANHVESGSKRRICISICDTDGCNSANYNRGTLYLHLLFVTLTFTFAVDLFHELRLYWLRQNE